MYGATWIGLKLNNFKLKLFVQIIKLLNDIQKFIEEAYTQMVIIKGFEPKNITLLLDRQAGQAVLQYSFF